MNALLSVIAFAASTLSPAITPPFLCPSASDQPARVEQASRFGGLPLKATCTALCGSSPSVSCTGDTCTATNQACPNTRGNVSCTTGGTTTITNCPVCTGCVEGQIKNVITGPNCSCDDGMRTPRDQFKCINGVWEYQFSFCGGPFCQGF